jgi:hypothetical protein
MLAQHGLAGTGDIFDQDVTTAQQRDQDQFHDPTFANDNLLNVRDYPRSQMLNRFHGHLNSEGSCLDAWAVYHDQR